MMCSFRFCIARTTRPKPCDGRGVQRHLSRYLMSWCVMLIFKKILSLFLLFNFSVWACPVIREDLTFFEWRKYMYYLKLFLLIWKTIMGELYSLTSIPLRRTIIFSKSRYPGILIQRDEKLHWTTNYLQCNNINKIGLNGVKVG